MEGPEASCLYQIVERLTQFVASYGQVGDATVISSLPVAGNCRAIFKDEKKAMKYFSHYLVAVTLAFGVLTLADRRACEGRLRAERLSSVLSVPLAMACRPTRQVLQYCALGLRDGRRPASLSSLTRPSVRKLSSSNFRVARQDFS